MKRICAMMLCMMFMIMAALPLSAACADADRTADAALNHYDMDISLDMDSGRLHEKIRLRLTNTSDDAWHSICLRDFMDSVLAVDDERSGMGVVELDEDGSVAYQGPTAPPDRKHIAGSSGIRSARCAGQELNVRTDGADPSIVTVELDRLLAPGASIVLELEYEADVPMGSYRCARTTLCGDMEHATYELAQFYPMLCVYEDGAWSHEPYIVDGECMYTECADYDIRMEVPERFTVVASGDEQRIDSANGMSVWQISARSMRDVTIIVSDEMQVISGKADGVDINCCYCACEDISGASRLQGELSLKAAQDSVIEFSARYGRYPYGELDVVESSYEFGGMEAPGLVRISQMYSWSLEDEDEATRKYYTNGLASTVAHEIAHEWFYALVGNDQYGEAWLDESFAAFSEQVYWRAQGRSEEEILSAVKEKAGDLDIADVTVDRSYAQLNGGNSFDYKRAVYGRGALMLYELEQAMGQDAFYDFVREYCARYAFGIADTQGFLECLSGSIEGNRDAMSVLERYISAA